MALQKVDVEPVNSAIASVTDPKNSVEPVAATLSNANQMDPIEVAKAQAKDKTTTTEQPKKGDYHQALTKDIEEAYYSDPLYSDHSPIIVQTETARQNLPRPFRLIHALLQHGPFKKAIQDV
ncbi:hypothetical protein RND71_012056 [Anisodus tanguticus]|uniref:Uncharacterized protein n=1 Tax=Anisodus tanguticus TaxID=243964 RepID=A0AAE1SCH4_9SOLA|nr:hypothetical protein RND71_012056 [Anisodus tanguticus]